MGVSRRAYAAHRGVSHTAVQKAIASGRIALSADGKIDPEQADREWDARTDPSQQRVKPAPRRPLEDAVKPVPRAAIQAVDETLLGNDLDVGGPEVSFLRARMANEILKAQTAKIRLQKLKGLVVDRAKAETMMFRLARQERDAWITWPARVAAIMAAELSAHVGVTVDPAVMQKELDKHVRGQLTELADIHADLG